MGAVAFLADMNISPVSVARLKERGWDIIRSSDLLPATASDDEILETARRMERVVITFDLDFSGILALGGHRKPSLVTLRLSLGDPDTITSRLLAVVPGLERKFEQGIVATIEDDRVRIRDLPLASE
jgi:predicted nuclease of predicted toxin-antitoxin system